MGVRSFYIFVIGQEQSNQSSCQEYTEGIKFDIYLHCILPVNHRQPQDNHQYRHNIGTKTENPKGQCSYLLAYYTGAFAEQAYIYVYTG
ncbi:hypothetical protein SDC9_185839 [bioreactor metagenome]|uniref:Uncharacterized protein n=1 Tax=bioreactor metagenome TaxID=1076179 RepID=A0A645HGZ8_9ZZZZ